MPNIMIPNDKIEEGYYKTSRLGSTHNREELIQGLNTIFERYLPIMDLPSIVMIHDTYDVNRLMDPKIAFDNLRKDYQYIEFVNRDAKGKGIYSRHGLSMFIIDNIDKL